MKLLVFAILIPFVYGECPPEPWNMEPPMDCNWPNVLCSNEVDAEGCTVYECKTVDPYAKCSSTVGNTCELTCRENQVKCSGGLDDNGCPNAQTCVDLPPDEECVAENFCPKFCGDDEELCEGIIDEKGCKLESVCVPRNDNCGTSCPVQCTDNQQLCSGPPDEFGCRSWEDHCIDLKDSNGCTAYCPASCGADEVDCGTQYDANGCPLPPKCLANDVTALCPNRCTAERQINCLEGEERCPETLDSNGCVEEPVCMEIG